MEKRERLSPTDTRRLIGDYTLYRFGYILSPVEFAQQAGVDVHNIEDLFAQKAIPLADLLRIARAIDVSPGLLSQMVGFRDMADETRASLDRYFDVVLRQPKLRRAA